VTGAATDRIRLLDLELDRVTEAGAIATIVDALAEGRGGVVVTPNLDQLRQLHRRPELAELFAEADLVVADGMPLVWASRLAGAPLPERVAGSDLVWSLTAEAALHARSVFLLGGAPGAAEGAEARLRSMYPGARFAGRLCPPLGFERDRREIDAVRSALGGAQPDIVYVALGFPKQERLIAYLRGEFPAMWFLGVGYSLSFVAGHTARAPTWISRLGLEWLHRLVKEPRRLAKRYLVHGLPFAVRLFATALVERIRGGSAVSAPPPLDRSARIVFPYGALERERARLLDDLMGPE
jgi:N-acetylglucosaminyldiphosphoundecaprenol N-acetyl-beta-D-mannosaminyltransferase